MINDFPFDFLRHVGDTVSRHVTFSSTSPTYSLTLLRIPPIALLGMPPMTLASFKPTPSALCIQSQFSKASLGFLGFDWQSRHSHKQFVRFELLKCRSDQFNFGLLGFLAKCECCTNGCP